MPIRSRRIYMYNYSQETGYWSEEGRGGGGGGGEDKRQVKRICNELIEELNPQNELKQNKDIQTPFSECTNDLLLTFLVSSP